MIVAMTVSSDKTLRIDNLCVGHRGGVTTFVVAVDDVIADMSIESGYLAYIDFLLPNGTSLWRGAYDCSSGTFAFDVGRVDGILDYDGTIIMQLAMCEYYEELSRKIQWLSFPIESKILA